MPNKPRTQLRQVLAVGLEHVPAVLHERKTGHRELSGLGKNRQRALSALGAQTFGEVANLPSMLLKPVRFPPGRARLSTKPEPIGSATEDAPLRLPMSYVLPIRRPRGAGTPTPELTEYLRWIAAVADLCAQHWDELQPLAGQATTGEEPVRRML